MSVVVVLLVIAGAGLWVGRVHWFGQRAHLRPARPLPAVVLGALVRPDGTPSPALENRVAVGVELLQSGRASRLVFSGGSPDTRPSEAAVMRRLAVAAGVDPSRCELEEASRSTLENARRCAALMKDEREILLVTCDYHLLRATRRFEAHGFKAYPVASRRRLSISARLWLSLREAVALL
jgi:uncharacterized SAM-binding protein YcdF (DUF218 family)